MNDINFVKIHEFLFLQLSATMETKQAEYDVVNAQKLNDLETQISQKDQTIEELRAQAEKDKLEVNTNWQNEQKIMNDQLASAKDKISQLETDLADKIKEMKEAEEKISCMNDDLETQIMDKMTAEEENESLKESSKALQEEIETLKIQKQQLNDSLQKACEKESELSKVRHRISMQKISVI